MAKQSELFGKTFDQQVEATGGNLSGKDLRPNILIRTELVFEPVSNGLRVTSRDESHHTLWGFIASEGMLAQVHCPVAIYDGLREKISAELRKQALPSFDAPNPVAAALTALDELEQTLDGLRKSITVKKESEATRQRACTIQRMASDANRTIRLETVSL